MEVRFGPEGLFQPADSARPLAPLLAACLTQGAGLRLNLDGQGASLGLAPPPQSEGHDAICFTGWWRSNALDGGCVHPGALLLAPLLFAFEALTLPARSLVRLDSRGGSAADLLAANLMLAALRRRPFRFERVARQGPETAGSRGLRAACLAQLRAAVRDDLLEGPNAMELLLAHAHLPIRPFSSPLLEQGAASFRATGLAHAQGAAA